MNRPLLHACFAIAVLFALPKAARAQRASLYQARAAAQPLTLENHSWLYVPLPPARELQINDLVTVVVNQSTKTESNGIINRITQSNIDARLQDWVELDHFGLKAAPQRQGDPRARGSLNSQLRTNAALTNSANVRFTITATIVDIRPNGNLVLEAHGHTRDDEEIWDASLTGIVRREDVLPNNTIFSEKVAELSINKTQSGHIKDAYSRGWLMRFYDHFRPF